VLAERERARWRLHLVRHRSSLKQRVRAVLLTHGKPCPVSDLFGVRGRQLLARLGLPEPLATNHRGQPAGKGASVGANTVRTPGSAHRSD
jgi:hypothetical protein